MFSGISEFPNRSLSPGSSLSPPIVLKIPKGRFQSLLQHKRSLGGITSHAIIGFCTHERQNQDSSAEESKKV